MRVYIGPHRPGEVIGCDPSDGAWARLWRSRCRDVEGQPHLRPPNTLLVYGRVDASWTGRGMVQDRVSRQFWGLLRAFTGWAVGETAV